MCSLLTHWGKSHYGMLRVANYLVKRPSQDPRKSSPAPQIYICLTVSLGCESYFIGHMFCTPFTLEWEDVVQGSGVCFLTKRTVHILLRASLSLAFCTLGGFLSAPVTPHLRILICRLVHRAIVPG